MRWKDRAELVHRDVFRTPVPPRRAARLVGGVAVVGFDTEWDGASRDLLSVQFAAITESGELRSRVFFPSERRLTSEGVAECLNSFLRSIVAVPPVVRRCRRVVLVSHYAAAEIGMFEDPLRELAVRQVGKAHHAAFPRLVDHDDDTAWQIRILDLYAFYETSLARVGSLVGLDKLDAERADLAALRRDRPDEFERYAARDAEICVLAFARLRQVVWSRWRIDVLGVKTLPALAARIFKYDFFKSAPCRVRDEAIATRRKRKTGWAREIRSVPVYDGPHEVRELALEAYWGGRVEAYVRGLVVGPVAELDVVSLYPHAALLQPLPNSATKWREVHHLRDVDRLEGFGRFEFCFPRTFAYPSLPVASPEKDRLAFPSSGVAACTFAEIRAAQRLGARVKVEAAWGFEPGAREHDHDVGRYMSALLLDKRSAAKGTLEYETAKLLLNALIGKLAERSRGDGLLEFEQAWRTADAMPSRAACLSLHQATSRGQRGVGGLWAPEWAALILGRSRALMAGIVASGALLVSTDSILLPGHLSYECEALDQLRGVGSDLKLEVAGDAAFIARSRLYAVLRRVDQLGSDDRALARDDRWAVVRVARHGTVETREQFAETVLACLRAGRDVAVERTKKSLVTAEQAARHGLEINTEVERTRKTKFTWDGKRRLLKRKVNPFTAYSKTSPYLTVGKLDGADRQRDVRARLVRRRRRRLSARREAMCIELLVAGVGVREVARRTRIPRSTVSDLKRRLAGDSDGRDSPADVTAAAAGGG